jgi:hypothetical protein
MSIDSAGTEEKKLRLRVCSSTGRCFAEQRELILSEIFLAEHPQDPLQLLFVAIVGEDRVTQPASSRLVHNVLNGLIHRSSQRTARKRNARG